MESGVGNRVVGGGVGGIGMFYELGISFFFMGVGKGGWEGRGVWLDRGLGPFVDSAQGWGV